MNQSHFLRIQGALRSAISLFFLASSCAWGFGGNDVAVKITELPEQYREVIVRGVAFSPDAAYVAVDSGDEKINIWDWRKNRIEKTITKPQGFNAGRATNPISYSPDGRWFAACEGRGAADVVVRVWDTGTWTIAKDLVDPGAGHATAMGFTPGGELLFYAIDRGAMPGDKLVVHGVNNWQPEWVSQMPDFQPFSMAPSPDGRFVAVGGSTLVVPANVVDPSERVRQIKYVPTINVVDLRERKIVRVIHGDAMGSIAWSSDGSRIATAGNSYVEVFNAASGERLVNEKLDDSTHMNIRFTPDGRYLVETDMNGKGTGQGVNIWDGLRLKLVQTIKGNIASVSVSRDSKYLAFGGTGRTTVWRFK